MSNIIYVKEERNVLSFYGEVFDIVANSTNFYLKFELDDEWKTGSVITAVFDFDGEKCYEELDDEFMCQIPSTNSSKVLFCLTTEPDSNSKFSSTILSLNVEKSGDTSFDDDILYQTARANLLKLIEEVKNGKCVNAELAQKATLADTATYATTAGTSETQVSLTGDESISGAKNFTGIITHNSNIIPDSSQYSNPNLLMNGNFMVNQRGGTTYERVASNLYTADRWGLLQVNGTFTPTAGRLVGQDETNPTILCQWIDDAKKLFYGKTITVSATINGVRHSKTTTLPETYSADYTENLYVGEGFTWRLYIKRTAYRLGVQFVVNNGVTIIIKEVKLEYSTFPTKYYERIFAEELNMCQRYFQKFTVFTIGYAPTAEKIHFYVSLPTTMKVTKTLQFIGNPKILKDGEQIVPDSIEVYQVDNNGVILIARGSGFTANQGYVLVNGTLKLDAEAYWWKMKF